MKKLAIIVIILTSLSGCSYVDFWTATEDTNLYAAPECPPVEPCNIQDRCLTPEDMRCLAKQKQAYKTCIWVHERAWDALNAK
tara:strand:- start:488 stop:736 length:249 start_codon:yes stop_codon:yes gene_type:complete